VFLFELTKFFILLPQPLHQIFLFHEQPPTDYREMVIYSSSDCQFIKNQNPSKNFLSN
jgi:hypothetical protein